MFNKCCTKILIPRFEWKVSVLDLVGLSILLSFYFFIIWVFTSLSCSILVDDIVSGEYSVSRWGWFHIRARDGAYAILFLYGVYKLLPKFLHCSSYLINYSLKIDSKCKICKKEHILANYPKNEEPFK